MFDDYLTPKITMQQATQSITGTSSGEELEITAA